MTTEEADIEIALAWGVGFILWLQGFSPALDWPFLVLTFLGNEGFYLLLLPFVYWCVDKQTGQTLAYLFLVSACLNAAAKELIDQPRPFEYDSRVKALVRAEGGGLPSGHTQHAVVVWGYLAMRLSRPWSWALAVFLMIGIPLSRLYLGVHFPTDLLGGYLLGALILLFHGWLGPRIEAMMTAWNLAGQLAAALILPSLLILLLPAGTGSGLSAGAALMGMAVGVVLEHRWVGFTSCEQWGKRICGFLVGVAVSVGLWAGLKNAFFPLEPEALFRFIRYGLLGLWISLGAPWVFCRLGLTGTGERSLSKQSGVVLS